MSKKEFTVRDHSSFTVHKSKEPGNRYEVNVKFSLPGGEGSEEQERLYGIIARLEEDLAEAALGRSVLADYTDRWFQLVDLAGPTAAAYEISPERLHQHILESWEE